MNLNEKVQLLTSNGYEFKFGKYLSDGLDYFKTQAGYFIGFFVVSILMVMVAGFIPVVGTFVSQILSATLLVGYFIAARKIKHGNSITFDDFFKGFSSIGQISIIQLILFGFSLILLMPLLVYAFSVLFSGIIDGIKENSFNNNLSPREMLEFFSVDGLIPLFIITIILLMFMQTIYSFAVVNAHFFKASAWESMEASRKVIQTKFFHFFGLIIVIALINLLGVLCLFVGLLVTVPMSYTIMYAAFDDIMEPDDEHELLEGELFETRTN
ncbi:MAG: hypothetical protein AB7O47_08885 [Flavobacteriales bacterium]